MVISTQFTKIFSTLLFALFCLSAIAENTVFINGVEVLDKTVIIKIKPEYKQVCLPNSINVAKINAVFSQLQVTSVEQKFPNSGTRNAVSKSIDNKKLVDLTTIYEIKYASDIALDKAYMLFTKINEIEYAEAKVLPKLLFTPDDTDLALQYYLNKIQAYAAWDIEKGNADMVIGISDTGYNFSHPDLVNQVKHNIYDPVDGIDNDNDGYVDNFSGWDLGNNDNDAQAAAVHGVHVSGLAGGQVNNTFGIAGVGYNCKLMPLKIDNNAGQLVGSYESIVYGADHGCKIINCSWGGVGFTQFGEDIVNYAIFNRNVLVIGAAGNNNTSEPFFPAAYKNVLSVAGTDANDVKWTGSSYGTFVDVCAPGDAIYSTGFGSGFLNSGGTSMAAPIVAGAAGIVWSNHPSYTALQVAQQLKVTCDNINSVVGNEDYINKLGSGRINMHSALTNTSSPSFVLDKVTKTDNNDNDYLAGETIDIIGYYVNYLATSSNTFVTISSNSPHVTFTDNTTNIGAIATGATGTHVSDPFKMTILNTIPENQMIELKFTIFDGTYSTIEYDSILVNTSFYNLHHNSISTSITGVGRIGYHNPHQFLGVGFSSNGNNSILYEGGLLIGTSTSKVSDCVRNDNNYSNDFLMLQRPQRVIPTVFSEYDLFSKFNDDNAASNKMSVEVNMKTYAWNTPADKDYIVLDYYIINKGNSTLSSMYVGLFTDWDINFAGSNRALLENSQKLGYAYDLASGGNYAATQLLSTSAPMLFYAFDNDGSGSGGINISDNFTKAEKYTALSANRNEAGMNNGGTDVITLMSSGPFTIFAGDTINVTFALHAGSSLAQLVENAKAAKSKFTTDVVDSTNKADYKKLVHLFDNFPNPSEGSTVISFYLPTAQTTKVKVFDYSGHLINVLVDQKLNEGYHNITFHTEHLNAGIYFYQLEGESTIVSKKMTIVK